MVMCYSSSWELTLFKTVGPNLTKLSSKMVKYHQVVVKRWQHKSILLPTSVEPAFGVKSDSEKRAHVVCFNPTYENPVINWTNLFTLNI